MDEIKYVIDEAREKGLLSLKHYKSNQPYDTYGASWDSIREAVETLWDIRQIIEEHEHEQRIQELKDELAK